MIGYQKNSNELSTPPPPPFTLSSVERDHSVWRYLWPFFTGRMFAWVICLLAVGALAVSGVVLLWASDPGVLPWALVGAMSGGLWMGPYRFLPEKLIITMHSDPTPIIREVAERMLDDFNYIVDNEKSSEAHVHFRHRHSVKNEWIFWSEQEVNLWRYGDNRIELRGPRHIVAAVRAHLRSKLWKLRQ
jgi:hypothetical protein